jgi:Carboxypeptidase regulatory-like domain
MERTRLAVWALLVAFVTATVVLAPHQRFEAQAQNLGQRNVTGSVVNADSTPLIGATVFLKNQKTKSIRSYATDKDGRFRFAQVNMTDDYDLWAEKDGKKSSIKTVSSWDARKEFETELKVK